MSIALSGSLVITGSIYATQGVTGSFSGNATSASYADTLQGLGSASFAPAGTFNTVSQSFATTSGSIAGRVTLIEGQYATTGSNTFTKPQQISDVSNAISFTSTASLYTAGGLRVGKDSFVSGTAYFNNIVVYGTSSIQYITSSQLDISDNIISVNTFTPAVRFGGLAVYDSGSTGLTGSILWDSEMNRWIYSNPSGSTYDGGMLISGPRNTTGLGNEVGTTSCALMMGQGGDHITSSAIFSYGNATCFYGNSLVVSGSGVVGVATTPSSWSGFTAFQVGNGAVWSTGVNNTHFSSNTYYDGANRTYICTGTATEYASQNGAHWWGIASSGTGGAVQTMTEYMRLTTTGLGIGTASPSYILDVSGSTVRLKNSGGSADSLLDRGSTSAGATSQYLTAGTLKWYTGLRGLANDNFYVFNNATSTNTLILDASSNAATFASSVTANSTGGVSGCFISCTFFGSIDLQNTGGAAPARWNVQSVSGAQIGGSAGSSFGIYSYDASAYRLFINCSGNVGIGTTSPAAGRKLTVAGGAHFSYTDNGGATFNIVPGTNGQDGTDFNLSYYTGTGYGPLTFTLGGAERMRITSDGSVGICTIAPAVPLQIRDCTVASGGSAIHAYGWDGAINLYTTRAENPFNAAIYMYNNPTVGQGYGTGMIFRAKSDVTVSQVQGAIYTTWTTATDASRTAKMVFQTVCSGTNADRMTILGSGQVGINTTNIGTEANLSLGAQGTVEGGQIVLQKGTTQNCATHLDNYCSQLRILSGTDTTTTIVNMVVDHIQRFVAIGRTVAFSTFGDSNGIVQYGDGTIYAAASNTEALGLSRIGTDGAVALFRRSTTTVGSICVTASATSYNTSSDYRLKRDLRNFNGIDLVNRIKSYDFQWNVDCSRMYGFIAHELAEVLPYAVSGQKDGEEMQSLDYSKLTPVLVKAIQEQQCTICSQASTINILKTCIGII